MNNGTRRSISWRTSAWSDAKEAKLLLKFVNARTTTNVGAPNRTYVIGDIERSVKINLEAELQAAGVNIAVLKENSAEGFKCRTKVPTACLREIVATGLFRTARRNWTRLE